MTSLCSRTSSTRGFKELEPRWYEDDARREEILDIFDEMVLQGDEPSNLCTTALITNAYLYTGDEKYKTWVLDYVQGWIDRIEANDGIIPDNVGSTGKVGRGPRRPVVGRAARLEHRRARHRPPLPRPHHRSGVRPPAQRRRRLLPRSPPLAGPRPHGKLHRDGDREPLHGRPHQLRGRRLDLIRRFQHPRRPHLI